jgi:hypothetical protein
MKFFLICFSTCLFSSIGVIGQTDPDCLIAKYYFNQGNANDDIGPYNGTVVGATLVPDRFGNPNAAYYLNGTPGSYINLGTTSVLKPATCSVSMWVNIAAPVYAGSGYSMNPILLTKGQPGNNCYEAYCLYYNFSSNKVATATTMVSNCNQPDVYTNSTVSLNVWHHFVFTYDYNFINMYCDGVLQGTTPKGFAQSFLTGDSVMIGNSANVQNNRFFNGTVDDIRFYHCVLSQTEVDALYNESDPMSVAENGDAGNISVYPNPVSDLVHISEPADILVTDVLGNVIIAVKNENELDLTFLAPGIYFMTLSRQNNIVKRERLVKK